MNIIIDNVEFDYNIGCRILKLKYTTSPFEALDDIWGDIIPLTFGEICQITNMEDRRVAFKAFGIERLIQEVNPVLESEQSISKTTTWVTESGELETINYNDVYQLYRVSGKDLNINNESSWDVLPDCFFVRCKDTSTDRDYLIWVEPSSVYNTNNNDWYNSNDLTKKITAIQAVAWTIQVNVAMGDISKIIRQGDCIMVKPKDGAKLLQNARHLTEKEYLELLVAES